MRNDYKDAFKLYPDGFVEFLIKQGNKWNKRCFFLELEHTSARDREKWIAKVRSYINLFEYKLGTYFSTDRTFVLVLVTDPEYVRHLKNLTETTLEEMGTEALSISQLVLFWVFRSRIVTTQFFCPTEIFQSFQ